MLLLLLFLVLVLWFGVVGIVVDGVCVGVVLGVVDVGGVLGVFVVGIGYLLVLPSKTPAFI